MTAVVEEKHRLKNFEIITMSPFGDQDPGLIAGPSPAKQPLTRAEKISLVSPSVAVLAAIVACVALWVNIANRQDAKTQTTQTQLNEQIDDRTDKKLIPLRDELHGKADQASVEKKAFETHEELSTGFEGVNSKIDKLNGLIGGVAENLAKLYRPRRWNRQEC